MKKITTLMVMLVCCICSALAQTVASTPTALSSLEDGYYVMLMKTKDSRTDNTNGNFVYYGADDNFAHYDAQSASEHELRNKKLEVADFKYVFKVSKVNGDSLTFNAFGTKLYWPEVEPAINTTGKKHLEQKHFTMSGTAEVFGYNQAEEGWDFLEFTSHEYTVSGPLWNRKYTKKNTTAYVSLNDDSKAIGYRSSAGDNNKIRIQLYKVSNMPNLEDLRKVTYEYYYNGVKRGSSSFAAVLKGSEYPEVDLSDFPDYVTASKPEGKVSNDETIQIELQLTTPFQVSKEGDYHYYYLDNAKGVRLFNNGGLKYRTAEQAEKINDIKNDLWYVTGNPFDGYYIHSVSGNGDKVRSGLQMSHTTSLSMSGSTGSEKWYIFPNGDDFSICVAVGETYYEFPKWDTTTKANQKNYSWRMDDNGNGIGFQEFVADNDAFRFKFTPATFTYTMYDGGDNHNYNTFSAPFDVKLAKSETDVKMYKGVADYEAKKFNMEEIAAAPAEAGIFLMGNNVNKTVTLEVTSGVATLEDNELKGNTTDVVGLEDKLILGPSTTTNEIGFFAAADGVTTLYANHAYLLRKTLSTVEGLSLSFGGKPTGMGQVSTSDVKNAPIYDLTGRRVNHTVKGQLYIQGGRKFIAR